MEMKNNPDNNAPDAYESAWIEAQNIGIARTKTHDLIARYFFEIGAHSALSTVKQSMDGMEGKEC